jgi:hypothetical protein
LRQLGPAFINLTSLDVSVNDVRGEDGGTVLGDLVRDSAALETLKIGDNPELWTDLTEHLVWDKAWLAMTACSMSN